MNYKIFIEASRRIAENESSYACSSIHEITSNWNSKEHTLFEEFFKPRNFGGTLWFGSSRLEKNQLDRSLALLFMAEIVKEKK